MTFVLNMENFDVIKERLINGKAFGSVASSPEIGAKYSDMTVNQHLSNMLTGIANTEREVYIFVF